MKLERIVIAIKPWERGLPLAATHARQLAEKVGAEIKVVSTVFDAAVAAGCERGDAACEAARERTLASARVELDRLAQSMREWGAVVTTKVVWGAPAYDELIGVVRQWKADLLVVGAHESRLPHTRLTDTDWQLMRRVPCPLLLVKDPVFDGYRTILAAIDPLHAHAEPYGLDRAVLSAARCFAHAFNSKFRAVHAFPGAAAFELASAVQVAPGVFYGNENVRALHERAVSELVAEYGIAPADVDLIEGSPAEVLIDLLATRQAELAVIGVPQRRGRLAAVIGSTAEAVVAEAPCDVLLVPVSVS